jgi:phage terminase small subunit
MSDLITQDDEPMDGTVSLQIKQKKPTIKQERFAQAYVANGGRPSQAYRTAYDADGMNANSVSHEATLLAEHPSVAPRIEEIAAQTLASAQMTPDYVVSVLRAVADDPDQHGQARVKAAQQMMRMLGLDVTRTVHEGTIHHDIDPIKAALSIEDLEALAADARKRLALDSISVTVDE